MGCTTSSSKEENKINKIINQDISRTKKKLDRDIKVLLLGSGESGKSTFFKQMKILSENNKFTESQLLEYGPAIQTNLVSQMKAVLSAAEWLNIPLEDPNVERARRIQNSDDWSDEIGLDLKILWKDKGVQQTYSQRNRYQLNDSTDYFFENIERYFGEFTPTLDDVLRVRIRTTGIEEAELIVDKFLFRIIDVGGQRSERRKWIHCFDSVTSIIFFTSIADYDQKLREDETVNRMSESLSLFSGICNIAAFQKVPFILFLNKMDLFQEKIKKVDLKICFDDFEGGTDAKAAMEHIKNKFLAAAGKHIVYPHFTIAIDTKNVELVFKDIRDDVLKKVLDDYF